MRLAAAVFLVFACAWLTGARKASGGMVRVTVTGAVEVSGVRRFGVNLGTWTSWGAEQLPANVLKNPGFEGLVDRALAIVAFSGPGEFSDDTAWLARPDGFWTGAEYEVLTGSAAGLRGRIRSSQSRGVGGLPWFETEGPAVGHGDVIALTRIDDEALPTQWWMDAAVSSQIAVKREARPGSPGVRSLSLDTPGAKITSYLDAIGPRAGKLLPVEGSWRLAFWAKGSWDGALLSVEFQREGAAEFLSQSVRPGSSWRRYDFLFRAEDSGPAGILKLTFIHAGGPGSLLLDDVELARAADDDGGFRAEVVGALEQLRPGYVRDWQGQLGDTLENRIAAPYARRAARYRPGGAEATDFGYGLAETLELCRRVGADPWLVVPTAFGEQECAGLGRYLGARAADFREVLVEFGNENWNPLFRPAGIPDPAHHAAAAGRCLSAIRRYAGPAVVRTVVNAQAANPDAASRLGALATDADVVAVAPYFLTSLEAGAPFQAGLQQLFTVAPVPGAIPRPAVYEVNLHTTGGDAPEAERRAVVGSAAAGAALSRTMLRWLRAGARRQCAYTLAGFDARLENGEGFVPLWGLTRDLAGIGHWRPTGRALVLVNSVIQDSLLKVSGESDGVEVFAFASGACASASIVNSAAEVRRVEIRFAGRVPERARLLTDSDVVDVSFERLGEALRLDLPAQSLVVLPAQGGPC